MTIMNIILKSIKVFRGVDDSKQQYIICIQGYFGTISEVELKLCDSQRTQHILLCHVQGQRAIPQSPTTKQ